MVPPPSIFFIVTWLASANGGYEFQDGLTFERDEASVACKHVAALSENHYPMRDIHIYSVQNDGKNVTQTEMRCKKFGGQWDAVPLEESQP